MTRPALLLATVRPSQDAEQWLMREQPEGEQAVLETGPVGRSRWLLALICRPWSRVTVYMAENDPAAEILVALTAVMITPHRILLRHDGTSDDFDRLHAILNLAGMLRATFSAFLALLLIKTRLLFPEAAKPKIKATAQQGILYVNAASGQRVGGALTHMVGVVNALAEGGVPVTAICDGGGGLLRPDIVSRPLPAFRHHPLPPEAAIYRQQRALFALIDDLVQRRRPATIYQRLTIGAWAAMLAARRHGIPYILEYNGSEVWISQNWLNGLRFPGIARRIEEASIEAADLIVTVSDSLRDELLQKGAATHRIVVAPNGVDAARFAAPGYKEAAGKWRSRQGIPEDAVVAAFVGTFGPWHGATVMAEAAKRILTNGLAPHMTFLFVGDGPQRHACEQIVAGLPAGAVRMTGTVAPEEIPVLLAAADILVAPHAPPPGERPFFGSPTKLFEYMAAGRAILASDLGQIGTVLEGSLKVGDIPAAGQDRLLGSATACGVLAKPGDPADLSAGLVALANHAALRDTLGRNARRRAEQSYGWNTHVDLVLGAARRAGVLLP